MSTFDFNEPLPPLNVQRARASCEPAARHYRDLTEDERTALKQAEASA
jgi:hypothetical protein